MARLQILQLPEGAGDERPPFVLVVDQVPTDEDGFDALRRDLGSPEDLLERIGARAVLVFEESVDIPANDTSAYLNTVDAPKTDYDSIRQLVREEIAKAHAETIDQLQQGRS
jgi:hypothetical protein